MKTLDYPPRAYRYCHESGSYDVDPLFEQCMVNEFQIWYKAWLKADHDCPDEDLEYIRSEDHAWEVFMEQKNEECWQ